MNLKKVLIIGLLISSIWAVNSDPENDNDEISSDENEDGKS